MAEENENQEERYSVEIYNGKRIMGVIEVSARTPQEASTKAFDSVNVRVKKSYLIQK